MTDFFSKIPAQFTRALILGAFFPVLLFLCAFTLVVLPLTPYGQPFVDAVTNPRVWQESPFVVLILTIIILVLSVVLSSMNVPIVRLYEGYPWKDSWIAKPLLAHRRSQFDRAKHTRERIGILRGLMRQHSSLKESDRIARETQAQLVRLMNGAFPDKRDSVLPTRLGNVIRAFETYTSRLYGIPIINLWPRLQAVVDNSVSQSLDSAKTAFDFLLHSAFLSGVVAVATAACGLYWRARTIAGFWEPWAVWALLFAALSYLLYVAAIPRAVEWGEQVKVAFDLNRLALLKKLGYQLEPSSLGEERGIWEIVNYQFAFPDERTYPDLPYKMPDSSVIVDPVSTVLNVQRSIKLKGASVRVRLIISNIDRAGWKARNVTVRERLPAGYRYIHGSAMASGRYLPIRSVEPLEIEVGPLAHGESTTVDFCLSLPK